MAYPIDLEDAAKQWRASRARAERAEAEAAQLLAERDELRRELQTLVDDIVNFPGHFDRDSESVSDSIKYLEMH
jgi:hypothetical protein